MIVVLDELVSLNTAPRYPVADCARGGGAPFFRGMTVLSPTPPDCAPDKDIRVAVGRRQARGRWVKEEDDDGDDDGDGKGW